MEVRLTEREKGWGGGHAHEVPKMKKEESRKKGAKVFHLPP